MSDYAPAPAGAPPMVDYSAEALAACEATFQRWLGDAYDLDALRTSLAVAAVEQMGGDLIWLLILGGSGAGKTETVMPFQSVGGIVASTITEASLLSGTSRKDTAKDATGGLLREVGDSGLIILKDVTTLLSMGGEARSQVLAALREIYDGHWVRHVGTDGGRTLSWMGRVAMLGAVTSAWDKAHAVIAEMGERFLVLRLAEPDSRALALGAMLNTGDEVQMRAELGEAVRAVMAAADVTTPLSFQDLTEEQRGLLADLANIVTWARSPVVTDFKGDPETAMKREQPTRFAKQLLQVVRGGAAVGMSTEAALTLAARVARDSMPPVRLDVLRFLLDNPESSQRDVMRALDLPRTTARRTLDALQLVGVVRVRIEDVSPDVAHFHYRVHSEAEAPLALLLGGGPDSADPLLKAVP